MNVGRKVSSEHIIRRPPWMSVRKDHLELQNGNAIDYYVIEQGSWCNVVPVTPSGEVVLVRQFRYPIARAALEIPGGYVDEGEEPLAAAKRELLEETGYGGGVWEPLLEVSPNPALFDNTMHAFLARGVEKIAEPSPDENESIEVELRPVTSILDLIDSGEIVHALNVAPLLRFLSMR